MLKSTMNATRIFKFSSNRTSGFLLLLWFLCFNLFARELVNAADPPKECTYVNETTNKIYDLNPLKKLNGEDWLIEDVYNTGYTFGINICSKILLQLQDDARDTEEVGVWGKDSNSKIRLLGKFTTKLIVRGDDVIVLEYKNGETNRDGGERCSTNNERRMSIISLTCDRSVDGNGHPTFVHNVDDCVYIFEWRTPVACPTNINSTMSGLGVFFTIFIIALIVYLIGGVFYNRMVNHASGIYQIPNWQFWSNVWDFIKDIFLILFAQCSIFKPKYPRRSYSSLPGDESNVLISDELEEH